MSDSFKVGDKVRLLGTRSIGMVLRVGTEHGRRHME